MLSTPLIPAIILMVHTALNLTQSLEKRTQMENLSMEVSISSTL